MRAILWREEDATAHLARWLARASSSSAACACHHLGNHRHGGKEISGCWQRRSALSAANEVLLIMSGEIMAINLVQDILGGIGALLTLIIIMFFRPLHNLRRGRLAGVCGVCHNSNYKGAHGMTYQHIIVERRPSQCVMRHQSSSQHLIAALKIYRQHRQRRRRPPSQAGRPCSPSDEGDS